MLQINTMMCGELASPGVRYSRVQQSVRPPECVHQYARRPARYPLPIVTLDNIRQLESRIRLAGKKGEQIQASGLDYPGPGRVSP